MAGQVLGGRNRGSPFLAANRNPASRRTTMAIDKQKRGAHISANVPFNLAQAVYANVKNGRHDSAGAVVRAALRHYLQLDDDDLPLAQASATPADEPAGKRRGRGKGPQADPPAE